MSEIESHFILQAAVHRRIHDVCNVLEASGYISSEKRAPKERFIMMLPLFKRGFNKEAIIPCFPSEDSEYLVDPLCGRDLLPIENIYNLCDLFTPVSTVTDVIDKGNYESASRHFGLEEGGEMSALKRSFSAISQDTSKEILPVHQCLQDGHSSKKMCATVIPFITNEKMATNYLVQENS